MSSHPALGAGVYCRSASVGATARIRIPAAERGVGVLPVPVEPYQIGGYSAVGETVWVYALGSGPGRRRREPAAGRTGLRHRHRGVGDVFLGGAAGRRRQGAVRLPGGAWTLTPREPTREPNGTLWSGPSSIRTATRSGSASPSQDHYSPALLRVSSHRQLPTGKAKSTASRPRSRP